MSALRKIAKFVCCQGGQTTVEYALLLAAVALPLIWVFRMLLEILVAQYQMIVFMIGLPFL